MTPHTNTVGEPPEPPPYAGHASRAEELDAQVDYILALDAWQPSGAWTASDKARLLDDAEAYHDMLSDRIAGWPQALVTPDIARAIDESNPGAADFVVGCFRAYRITDADAIFAHVQSVRPDADRAKWNALVAS